MRESAKSKPQKQGNLDLRLGNRGLRECDWGANFGKKEEERRGVEKAKGGARRSAMEIL